MKIEFSRKPDLQYIKEILYNISKEYIVLDLPVVVLFCYNHEICTKYETCANRHRFHILYIFCSSTPLMSI